MRPPEGSRWLLFPDRGGVGENLAGRLSAAGCAVVRAVPGGGFAESRDGGFTIDPAKPADWAQLIGALASGGRLPDRIVHLWTVGGGRGKQHGSGDGSSACEGLLALAAALEAADPARAVEIGAVSTRLHDISGAGMAPERAPLLAACQTIPRRHPRLACRSLDVARPRSPRAVDRLAAALLADLLQGTEPVVAYDARGNRWVRALEPVNPELAVAA